MLKKNYKYYNFCYYYDYYLLPLGPFDITKLYRQQQHEHQLGNQSSPFECRHIGHKERKPSPLGSVHVREQKRAGYGTFSAGHSPGPM